MQRRNPGRRNLAVQPGEQRLAHLDGPVDLSGHREHLGQCLVNLSQQRGTRPRVTGGDQETGPGQRMLGAGQRAYGQVTPPGLEQQRAGPRPVTRPLGQVGGQQARLAGETGMRRLHRRQRLAGQQGPFRRQQPGQHCVVGQRVPEPEAVAVGDHELQADAAPQRCHHRGVGQAGERAQQRPVEPAAEDRGRAQHPAGIRVDGVEPPPYRVGERARDPGRGQVTCLPGAIPLGQRPFRDQAREDLLDQEWDALGPFGDKRLDRARQVGGAHAGQGHPAHRRRVQPAQRQHGRGPAGFQRAGQAGRAAAFLVAQGAEAEHPLGRQVVGQVLKQGQRLQVGPVQVLQHEQAPGLGGEHAQQPQHRLAEDDQGFIAGRALRRPPLRYQPPERGPERIQVCAVRQAACPPGRHQRLGEGPERRGHAAGHRPPGQHDQAARLRRARGLADQPRLPDPGFAGQEHDTAAACLRPDQGGLQVAGLVIPRHQHGAQHLPHRISIPETTRLPSQVGAAGTGKPRLAAN